MKSVTPSKTDKNLSKICQKFVKTVKCTLEFANVATFKMRSIALSNLET